jgi:hypothetical protein
VLPLLNDAGRAFYGVSVGRANKHEASHSQKKGHKFVHLHAAVKYCELVLAECDSRQPLEYKISARIMAQR